MSVPSLHAAAISRRDGTAADGIHLLFEAPATAGHSINGFDIERRLASDERRRPCVSLTPDQLQTLADQLAVLYEHGRIELRRGACPAAPPKEPTHGTRICVRFDRVQGPQVGPNPVEAKGAGFHVFDEPTHPAARTRLVTGGGVTALEGGVALRIELPADAKAIELTLVVPKGATVLAEGDGQRFEKKVPADDGPQVVVLGADGLRIVHVVAEGGLALVEACWRTIGPDAPREPVASELVGIAAGMRAAASSGGCLVYDFSFLQHHDQVLIGMNVPMVLAIALRQGKAVATAGGGTTAEFVNRQVDRVVVYTPAAASAIRVCVDVPDPKEEQRGWASAKTIAKNVNFPVRAINSSLATAADERQLADSRLLPGESFDAAAFDDVTRMLNAAASVDPDVVPVWSTTLTRERLEDPFVELRSWAYATLPKLDAQWRRMLGLGWLDEGTGLVPGQKYDYRVIGRFRRRDVAEQLLGFQAVPLGTTLPRTFALGDVLLSLPSTGTVVMQPDARATDLEVTGRKGIFLEDPGFFGHSLRIELPAPVVRIALDIDPGHSLTYKADSSALLGGTATATFSGAVPSKAHAVLDFAAPVDAITFDGKGLLYGLRPVAEPGADPDDVLVLTRVIAGVVYQGTPDPAPPDVVGADNLQVPPSVAPPSGHPPPSPLGFRVRWLPPGGSVPWPPDLAAAPPFDVLGFGIERRRVDSGGGWQEIAAKTPFLGSRGTQPTPITLYAGQDLLSVFPEWRPPQPPVSPFMECEDALERTGADPPPGSTHQYRVHCIDAIGRRSPPALSPVVRLEKHTPPPQPAGRQDTPAGIAAPAGVTGRILQASDPALSAADRAHLGAASTAVLIEWGWTAEQRQRDPHATEFRVYWDATPPDLIEGELTGAATLAGTEWSMSATLQRAVAVDAMAGRYIRAGDRPFRVVGHTGGTAISIVLARSAIDATLVPGPGRFVFQPLLDGSELRPAGWEHRSAVVPIGPADSYRHVFTETVSLDVAHPSVRVWTGVSAADDQPYVADELPATTPLGGRPGNESSIAPGPAAARWIGRPVFTVPLPLPDVPEQRTREPVGEDVRVRLDLPTLLAGIAIPAGHRLRVERLPLADVVGALGATATDEIRMSPPAGAPVPYTLGNAADQAALLAQIRSGVASTVERRFLMDALLRRLADFETAWVRAVEAPVPVATLEIELPGQAERYAVRVRLVDALGNVSAGGAVLAHVLRVPSLRASAPPVLAVRSDLSDALEVTARVRDVADVSSVLFFLTAIVGATVPAAELLRTPNRPDLYPTGGIRLRLADGTLLAPTVADVSTGTVEAPDRRITTSLVAGFEQQVAVWAATLTQDGVPSRLAGPSVATTGPQPLVVPALTVAALAGEDQAAWSAPGVAAEIALQRSVAAGAWVQVSPWLPGSIASYVLPGSGTRAYRLVLRASRGRTAEGPAVTPS